MKKVVQNLFWRECEVGSVRLANSCGLFCSTRLSLCCIRATLYVYNQHQRMACLRWTKARSPAKEFSARLRRCVNEHPKFDVGNDVNEHPRCDVGNDVNEHPRCDVGNDVATT